MRKTLILGLVLFAVTTACNSASTPYPTSTPGAGAAAAESTSIPLPITVSTTGGKLSVTKEGRADGWPVGCNPSAPNTDAKRCFVKPDSGQTILVVYYSGVKLSSQDAFTLFVTEGTKSTQIKSTLSGDSPEGAFYGFMVSSGEKHITLHWPGAVPFPIS
jgi:hypothetical protein